jgi:hypothetical protein
MKSRFLGIAGVLATAVSVAITTVMVAGQAPSTAGAGTPARTPWGTPDLTGLWNSYTLTPLERPAKYADRATLTDKEAADLAKQLADIPDQARSSNDEHDVAGAYNHSVFFDRVTTFTRNRTSLIVDPPNGRVPPFTPEGQKRIAAMREYLAALLQGTSGGKAGPTSSRRGDPPPMYNVDRMNRADGPEDRSTMERCFGFQLPIIGGNFASGATEQIVLGPDSMSIFYDIGQGWGFTRNIPITDAPHLPATIRQHWGDARGRWDGDTLVVDTTNFTQKTEFYGSRENLHLVERFTRTDANTLTYRVTLEDPTTWTRPWTAEIEMTKNPDKDNLVFEQTCHEGNYGLLGMIVNTRAAEKAFSEGKGPDPATTDIATGGEGPKTLE